MSADPATPIDRGQPRSRLSIWGLLEAASLFVCLATVTGFLAPLWWILELTCHFKVQLAVALCGLTILWLWRKRWWLAGVCGIAALINTMLVLQLFLPPGKAG